MNVNDVKQSSQMETKIIVKYLVDYTVRKKRVVYALSEEQAKTFVENGNESEKVIIHSVEPSK